ncbi:MAG: ribosome maturation factor RimM [Lachnospiraceae bacterium]|nr:ribosome maturation factor RimM [Lachnospiraceae bacterium]
MEDRFKVGVLLKPHGIKGEVKAYPTTDDAKRFRKLKEVILKPVKGPEMTLRIVFVRFFKNLVILKFDGIDTPEAIREYSRAELYVNREDAVKLEENEYFIADLIGIEAVSDDGALKGTLEDVLQTGANDVYVIRLEDKRQLLLPAIRECILNVDPEGGRIVFHLMDGLLD